MATKKMTLGNSSTTVNLEANGTVVGSNIKNKGNSAKPVYFDNDGNAVPIENELVTYEVSETEPTDPNVGIWLKKEQESVFVPTMEDFNELENKVDELNTKLTVKNGSLTYNAIGVNNYDYVMIKQTGNVVHVSFRLKNNGVVFETTQFNPCTIKGVTFPSVPQFFTIGTSHDSFAVSNAGYGYVGTDGAIYLRVAQSGQYWCFVNITYIV